jgi:lysozyme
LTEFELGSPCIFATLITKGETIMANENMRMSAEGVTALRLREGAVLRYYNDAANHCTYGVGTLVHRGPCTAEELERPVTVAQINTQLALGVRVAEAAVRRQVPLQTLTQAQFDALVSFTFNTGATGAAPTLAAANRGASAEVTTHMNNNVYVRSRAANGSRLPPVRLQGLVNRRREEAQPFQTPPVQPSAATR